MSGVGINQSVLSPAGIQASSIHALWLLMLSVCTAVFIAVLAALLVAVVRGSRRRSDERISVACARRRSRGASASPSD